MKKILVAFLIVGFIANVYGAEAINQAIIDLEYDKKEKVIDKLTDVTHAIPRRFINLYYRQSSQDVKTKEWKSSVNTDGALTFFAVLNRYGQFSGTPPFTSLDYAKYFYKKVGNAEHLIIYPIDEKAVNFYEIIMYDKGRKTIIKFMDRAKLKSDPDYFAEYVYEVIPSQVFLD